MNYKLAKQLKDAGFPKKTFKEMLTPEDLASEAHKGQEKFAFFSIPTLSELIDACGDEFKGLYKNGDEWEAGCTKRGYPDEDMVSKTPEEAVAKLWLKIH